MIPKKNLNNQKFPHQLNTENQIEFDPYTLNGIVFGYLFGGQIGAGDGWPRMKITKLNYFPTKFFPI